MKRLALLTMPALLALGACQRGSASANWPTEPSPAAELEMEPGFAYGPELEEDAEGPMQDEEWIGEGEQQALAEREPPEPEIIEEPFGADEPAQMEAQGPIATMFVIEIDPEILTKCDRMSTNAIFFETDEAKVQQRFKDDLQALASCMNEGPLRGEDLTLIGMADHRGPFDYNYDLGGERAGSVARFLSDQGVQQSRLHTASLGERLASPQDAQSPAYERRVSIFLADNSPWTN